MYCIYRHFIYVPFVLSSSQVSFLFSTFARTQRHTLTCTHSIFKRLFDEIIHFLWCSSHAQSLLYVCIHTLECCCHYVKFSALNSTFYFLALSFKTINTDNHRYGIWWFIYQLDTQLIWLANDLRNVHSHFESFKEEYQMSIEIIIH